MGLAQFSRAFIKMFGNVGLLLRIIWEMHVHYARLYNLKLLVQRYFEAWRLIHFPEKYEQLNQNSNRYRVVTIGAIYGICLVTFIRTVQMALSMTIPMSVHWRILYWDQMLFQNAIPQLNLIYVIITPFCIFFYHRMYFYRSGKPGQMKTIWLACLVLNEDGDPRYREDKSVMYIDCDKVRRMTRKNIAWLQYYNLYFELAYVYYLIKIVLYICEHLEYFFTTLSGYLSLFVILVNGSIAFLYTYNLLMEYIQITVIGVIITLVIFQRMRQIDALLRSISQRHKVFKSHNLFQFCRNHTLVLLDIFETNRLFGPILLSFIIGAVPTSAYQIVLLMSKHMSNMTKVNFVNLSLYQIGVVFGFHLAAAMYSSQIHRCAKRLNHLSASKRSYQSFGSRLKLSLYIEKFHTQKKYGITYMNYGLISFKSFFKFTFLYGELLMFSYRWIKLNQQEDMMQ